VIKLIRASDEPKPALMTRFKLSERQAEDILEIRLRQLARLEGVRIEEELAGLKSERAELEALLADDGAMKRLVVKEIQADAKQFGDPRRTLIEESERAMVAVSVVVEPVTIVVSQKAWLRARAGHGLDLSGLSFKDGDGLRAVYECLTNDQVTVLASDGRTFSIPVAQIPGGKGEGAPAASFLELQSGARIAHAVCGKPEQKVLLATSGGYGFVCTLGDMASRVRAGKQFLALQASEEILPPAIHGDADRLLVAALSSRARLLLFPLQQMKALAAGGRGVMIQGLGEGETVLSVVVTGPRGVTITGTGRGGKPTRVAIGPEDFPLYLGARGRKGRHLTAKIKPTGLERAPLPGSGPLPGSE
jgi:topoisomerase-4 subunit A